MKPKFHEKLKNAKFFLDFSMLLTFCHLLNKLRQLGQNNPMFNPARIRIIIKNHASGYNIWTPVRIGVRTEFNIKALRIPKYFVVINCPAIGAMI